MDFKNYTDEELVRLSKEIESEILDRKNSSTADIKVGDFYIFISPDFNTVKLLKVREVFEQSRFITYDEFSMHKNTYFIEFDEDLDTSFNNLGSYKKCPNELKQLVGDKFDKLKNMYNERSEKLTKFFREFCGKCEDCLEDLLINFKES